MTMSEGVEDHFRLSVELVGVFQQPRAPAGAEPAMLQAQPARHAATRWWLPRAHAPFSKVFDAGEGDLIDPHDRLDRVDAVCARLRQVSTTIRGPAAPATPARSLQRSVMVRCPSRRSSPTSTGRACGRRRSGRAIEPRVTRRAVLLNNLTRLVLAQSFHSTAHGGLNEPSRRR
jgi:hypothetical protein